MPGGGPACEPPIPSRAEAARQKAALRGGMASSRLASAASGVAILAAAAALAYGTGHWCTLPALPPGLPSSPARIGDDVPLEAPVAAALQAFVAAEAATPFHHISLCSRPHPKFALLQESAAWHGDAVVPLGMGDQRFQRWGWGFGVKLVHVQEYVGRLPPDDLVMFTDAFDVLMMGSQADVRAAYFRAVELAMLRERVDPAVPPGAPPRVPSIVFSTEFYCWPDSDRASEYPASDRAFEFAFLNSGERAGESGWVLRALV